MTKRWRRFSLASLLLAVTATAIGFGSRAVTEGDRIDAARQVVAWIVEGRRMPGFDEDYPDFEHMRAMQKFYVACDFLPADYPLSDDPRVVRLSQAELDGRHSREGWDYGQEDYLVIVVKESSAWSLVLDVSNSFGGLAAHGYDLEFRKVFFRLLCRGEITWVS